MKQACILLVAIFTFSASFSADITASTNGNWITNGTWDLNRLPTDGDVVIIPNGKTVTISSNVLNSANSYFLKIYGALQFSGSGKIDMSSTSRVYVFSGASIIGSSASQALRINGVDKFKGTEGTLNGPKYATSSTPTSPNGFVVDFALPVKFIAFNVARQNTNVLVQWTTAEEMNSRDFEVQRSENGIDWTTVSSITAAGITSATHSYSYTDKNIISKLAYYRIRQVDMDGGFSLTPVRMIKNEVAVAEVKITAPSSNSIYVYFSGQVKGNVIIRLTTLNGQIISQKTFDSPIGQVIVPAQNSNKGIYIVTVADGQELKFSKQVLL